MANRLVDTSGLFQPYRQSGAAKGQDAMNTVLDAILQRRAAMQREELQAQVQREQLAEQQRAARATGAFNQYKEENDQANADRNAALAAQQQSEVERQNNIKSIGEFNKLGADPATRGQAGAYGQAAGVARPMAPPPMPEEPQMGPDVQLGETPTGSPYMGRNPADVMAQRTYQQQMAERQQKMAAQRNSFDVGMPGGPSAPVNLDQAGPAGDAAQAAGPLGQLKQTYGTNPGVMKVIGSLEPAVAGGLIKPDQAMAQINEELDRQAALERTLRTPRNPGIDRAAENTTDNARADIGQYMTNTGYKNLQGSRLQFQKMLDQASLAQKGGPAAANAGRIFLGMFTKYAQGEVGVLTPSDIDTFWTKAGSPATRSEDYIQQALTGELGADKLRGAKAAIQGLRETVEARQNEVYRGAVEKMRQYGERGESWLKSYFGRGFPENADEGLSARMARSRAKMGGGGAPAPAAGGTIPRSLRR